MQQRKYLEKKQKQVFVQPIKVTILRQVTTAFTAISLEYF